MEGRRRDLLSLLELVELSRWQRLQDHFASVLGVPLRTLSSSHELLTTASWPQAFDAERAIRVLRIGEELDALLPTDRLPSETLSLTTILGITYAAVPICASEGEPLAYFVVGPMVVGPLEHETTFSQRLAAMGLDAEAVWSCLVSLKLYTFASIRSALRLIEEVGNSIAQLARQTRQLSSLLPKTNRIDAALLSYHSARLFQSLLEAATLATKAEGGSVMVYDPLSQAFHVKAAQGLSDAVVANTKVARGAGIAGLAAQEKRILLLDHEVTDERLRHLMHRPELVSSLVAPLMVDADQEPLGVLNLRTTDPERRFTQEHVEVLRRLLDLAGMALRHLPEFLNQARTSTS